MPKEIHEEYNLRIYIYKLLKQVNPNIGITRGAMNEINLILYHMVENITRLSNTFIQHGHKATLSVREIYSSVKIFLPGELSKHAISEGTKAVTKYNALRAEKEPGQPKQRRSYGAGLTFPISRIGHLIRINMSSDRMGETAPVYLAAVLEYLCAEILELASQNVQSNKKVRITTRDLLLAIKNDEELNKLLNNATLSGGVLPNIDTSLLPKSKAQK